MATTDSFKQVVPKPAAESNENGPSQKLEISPQDIQITRIIYITPHQSLTSEIRVHDLTTSLSQSSSSKEFLSESESVGQSLIDATPLYTLVRQGWWHAIPVYQGKPDGKTDSDAVATWRPSRGSLGTQKFAFPPNSPNSSHTLSMKRPSFRHSELFVQESVEYIWRFESRSIGKVRRPITLWKKIGNHEIPVARFQSPYRVSKTGGTLIVNEKEVDLVVAFVTCCGMLRKIRQRR
jgi:hypothetical protein